MVSQSCRSHTYYHNNMLTKPTSAERKAELEAKHAEQERKLAEEHAAEEALAHEIEHQEEQERREEERQRVEEERRQAEEAQRAEEFQRLEEERRVAEFRRMEQERKAAEAVAEDAKDEDMTVLSWKENLEKEKQWMRVEAATEASKGVGKLRLGACWPCIKNSELCVRER